MQAFQALVEERGEYLVFLHKKVGLVIITNFIVSKLFTSVSDYECKCSQNPSNKKFIVPEISP